MKREVRFRPGRGQSILGLVVGIIFCLIGIFLVIPTFGPFGIFWTAIAAVITIMSGYNAFSKRGMTSGYVEIEEQTDGETPPETAGTETARSASERLEELRSLYAQGLVTREEFEEKRREILDSI